jgi:signal-transduction protein with cAMP-binding, CBS, and nucleotidyltransferase domain
MSTKENFFTLKQSPPFDRLDDSELILLSNLAIEKYYSPGSIVCRGQQPLRYLYVTMNGSLWMTVNDQPIQLSNVFGHEFLLRNYTIAANVTADAEEGATCLLFKRENFFTIAYECPSLILGFCQNFSTKSSQLSLLIS